MNESSTSEVKTDKIKVTKLQIIVSGTKEKPYYELMYKEVGKDDFSIGYSSYDLNNVFDWKENCFELVVTEDNEFNLWKGLEVFCATIRNIKLRNIRVERPKGDEIVCGSLNIHCYNSMCDHNTPENTCMYGVTMDLIRHAQSDKPMCEKLRKEVLRRFCGRKV